MFSLFQKKPSGPKVRDLIFMEEAAKLNALIGLNPDEYLVICWFEATRDKLQQLALSAHLPANHIYWYRQVSTIQNRKLIFAEHHPLAAKEKELYQKLSLQNVEVYSALTEPLFTQFGGQKILELLQKLGMAAAETMEHNMISSSIVRAQEKIAEKVSYEHNAHSQQEWIEKHIKV
jgi:hypothetical protein